MKEWRTGIGFSFGVVGNQSLLSKFRTILYEYSHNVYQKPST